MDSKMKRKIKRIAKHLYGEVKENKFMLAYMTAVVMMQDTSIVSATQLNSSLPWSSGLTTIYIELTGPIPKVGAGIAIATGAGMYMFGNSQVTQLATRVSFGAGAACASPSLLKALAGDEASGCLF